VGLATAPEFGQGSPILILMRLDVG